MKSLSTKPSEIGQEKILAMYPDEGALAGPAGMSTPSTLLARLTKKQASTYTRDDHPKIRNDRRFHDPLVSFLVALQTLRRR